MTIIRNDNSELAAANGFSVSFSGVKQPTPRRRAINPINKEPKTEEPSNKTEENDMIHDISMKQKQMHPILPHPKSYV